MSDRAASTWWTLTTNTTLRGWQAPAIRSTASQQAPPQNIQARVQDLGYISGGLTGTAFDGRSNYNSLQVTVRKQFSHGFTMQAAYTWSKDLGDLTGSAANSGDPTNLAQQYGPVGFSRPQRLIINYAYDLPFGRHDGAAGYLLNGWNVSGVTTIQNGTPLTITDGGGGSIFGVTTSRAQMCPGATYASGSYSGRRGIAAGRRERRSRLHQRERLLYRGSAADRKRHGLWQRRNWHSARTGPVQLRRSLIKTTRIRERHTRSIPGGVLQLLQSPAVLQPGDSCGVDPGEFRADHHDVHGGPAGYTVRTEVQLLNRTFVKLQLDQPGFLPEGEGRAFAG